MQRESRISILHKYDYNEVKMRGWAGTELFQFYISTITTQQSKGKTYD